MSKNNSCIVYVLWKNAGHVWVGSTTRGMSQARKVAKRYPGWRFELLEVVPVPDELVSRALWHLAQFIRKDFNFPTHWKAVSDIALAKKLYLGGFRRSKNKGNPKTLMPKQEADPLAFLNAPQKPMDPWDYSQDR